MNGALARVRALFGVVVLATHAIQAAVHIFVDIPILVDLGEEFLNCFVVTGLGSADEVVVGNVKRIPRISKSP